MAGFHAKQAASLMEGNNRLAHYFGLFRSFGLLLGYLATSGAKSDISATEITTIAKTSITKYS